jgi:hypothetical protein
VRIDQALFYVLETLKLAAAPIQNGDAAQPAMWRKPSRTPHAILGRHIGASILVPAGTVGYPAPSRRGALEHRRGNKLEVRPIRNMRLTINSKAPPPPVSMDAILNGPGRVIGAYMWWRDTVYEQTNTQENVAYQSLWKMFLGIQQGVLLTVVSSRAATCGYASN